MSKKVETYGQIKDGKPYVVKRDEFFKSITYTFKEGERFRWVAEKLFRKRSNALNSYYWGVIIDLYIKGEETVTGRSMGYELVNKKTGEVLFIPYSKEQKSDIAHENLKALFNEGKSTTENTNSKQMEYHEYCREYIKFCYNIEVPLPNETLKIF